MKASNSSRFVTGFYQKYVDELTDHPDFWVRTRALAHPGGESTGSLPVLRARYSS